MNKKVDVVIPVYKPDEKFNLLLKRLKKQKMPINKIIIMHTEDGKPLDWISEIFENIVVVELNKEQFDHGATRDDGISISDGEIVVCMTQDAVPADDLLLENLVRNIGKNKVAAAYARQLPNGDCEMLERYTRTFNYPAESRIKSKEDLPELGIKTFFCSDVCAAYDKKVYHELGGFVKRTIFNEDMLFAAKLIENGYKVSYESEAKVFHSHNYTNIEQFKRNFDMAVSQADHPEVFAQVKSETEGIRMVKKTAVYVLKKGRPWKIISLVLKSGSKYLGYKLGLQYKKMPLWLIKKCTMNLGYWINNA